MSYMNIDDDPKMAEQLNRISSEFKAENFTKEIYQKLKKENEQLKNKTKKLENELSAIRKILVKNNIK